MAPLTPLDAPDPERVGPPRNDRRWLAVPVLVVGFVVVALAKPWGDGRPAAVPPQVSGAALTSSLAPAETDAPTATSRVTGDGMPAAATVVHQEAIDAVPWANELIADVVGAWAWSDTGVVTRMAAFDNAVTRTDLGKPAEAPGPLGSRGMSVAWSQIWASDPAHRGLARLDQVTGKVAERIPLWSEMTATAVAAADGPTHDRWASAWGFAIDGDSIFVPSIAPRSAAATTDPATADGQLWRVDTTNGPAPGWIPIDHPTGVAVGFGSIWVVSCCGDHSDAPTSTIVRLEEQTGGVQASITLPVPEAVADGRPVIRVGPDSVWVGLDNLPLIVRIDPATSSVRSTLPVELPVTDLALGPGGALWVTESEPWHRFGAVLSDRCDGRLVRIDPVSEQVVAATTMSCPMSVAISGDDVWVGVAGTEGRGTSGGVPPMLVRLRALPPPS